MKKSDVVMVEVIVVVVFAGFPKIIGGRIGRIGGNLGGGGEVLEKVIV